jgi:hypothetical protein
MADEAGLAALVGGPHKDPGSFSGLHAFALLEHTCKPELWLGGAHEMLARAIHEEYIRLQASLGETPQGNPSMAPWEELPMTVQESNRAQADHVAAKLAAVGCEMEPLVDWNAESFAFSDAEVETMARMEHERYLGERRLTGRARQAKDLTRSLSPYLVPWDQLPEDAKELHRTPVRLLPRLLSGAGLQVRRTCSPGAPPRSRSTTA